MIRTVLDRDANAVARRSRATLALGILGLVLLLTVLLSIGSGAVAITPAEVFSILLTQLGAPPIVAFEVRQEAVLLAIRLPRVVLGALVGSTLAVCGAAMQGLFRNPLASPGLLGVSSGAAVAVASMIVLGARLALPFWFYSLPLAAFAGSLLVTLFVYAIATRDGQTDVVTMLLAGVAINALAGAGTGVLTFMADDAQLRDITFWSLGSLGGATWRSVSLSAPFMLLGLLAIPYFATALNSFLLGESEAMHLGVHVQRVKRLLILLTACAVGAAVSVSGTIGFVGLVVPHLFRLMIGPDHRSLLWGSAFLGASMLLLADLLARTVVAPAELPIGIVTALAGGPFFLWLLLRYRWRSGW